MPATEDNLLVPRISGVEASAGSAITSAGSWMSPPPPTTESTHPATNAARTSAASTQTDTPSAGDAATAANDEGMAITVL